MSWFAAKEDGGPIAGHHIITTDWSLRQRLIDNIIYANGVRRRILGAHVIESSPNQGGAVVQTNSYGIYRLEDGNHAGELTFASNATDYTSIQVIQNWATWRTVVKWPGHNVVLESGQSLYVQVKSGQNPEYLAKMTNNVLEIEGSGAERNSVQR